MSTINAINSELVGFPFPVLTVYPNRSLIVSILPRLHATSIAWRIARSTRLEVVWRFLAMVGYRTPKLLITTNLDNDDAFSSDVVELLQRELRPAPGKRIYSLLYGYQYFTDRRFALKMRYTNNHFLTLAEPFDAHTETIISYRHTKAIRQLPTTYLSTARGKWLEIVHEDNVSNDFRINIKVWYIPLLYGRSFADFGLGGFRLSCARQWAATLLVVPARFFATAVRRLRRKWSK